jgi:prevent-host-death family protein
MIVKATELKNRLGQYLDTAIKQPVFVEKSGRKVAVIVSNEEYERLQTADDYVWGTVALAAKNEGITQDGLNILLDIAKEKGVDVNFQN